MTSGVMVVPFYHRALVRCDVDIGWQLAVLHSLAHLCLKIFGPLDEFVEVLSNLDDVYVDARCRDEFPHVVRIGCQQLIAVLGEQCQGGVDDIGCPCAC